MGIIRGAKGLSVTGGLPVWEPVILGDVPALRLISSMLAATSIEIATLVIALIAAIGAVTSAAFAGVLASRAEHRSWQRDLRQQLFSASIKLADDLLYDSVPNLYRYIMEDGAPDQAKEDALVSSVVDDANALRRSIADVQTFGSKNVTAAGRVLVSNNLRLLALAIDADRTQTQLDDDLTAARDAFNQYREAIRQSLRIADD